MTKVLTYAITATLYALAPAAIGMAVCLVLLRLLGALAWGWGWVFAPMWGCSLLLVVLFLLACIFDDGEDGEI